MKLRSSRKRSCRNENQVWLTAMEPPKSKVKSSSNNSDLKSETKGFTGKSSECQIASLNEISDSRNTSVSAMAVAMDNHLILQEIFKFFSPTDLRRIICEVCEKWRDIAGPMIFEYQLQVDCSFGIKVETSKGYVNPQIEKRQSCPEAETEYLKTVKSGNVFISLEFCGGPWTREIHEKENYSTVDFVKKLRSQVYKLSCCDYNYLHKFLRESSSKRDLELLPYFPNCEEYCVSRLRSLDLFFNVEMPSQMNHLRRVYHGYIGPNWVRIQDFPVLTPTILKMTPNLEEIHGVPFSVIREFVKAKKLHLVRSIRFHVADNTHEMEAMQAMVQLGMKFRFLRIGGRKNLPWQSKKEFINRNRQHFEDLLEIGKDTLQHLALHIDRPENFIDFPTNMSALTHIALKTECSTGSVVFPMNFNFSECFPKLTTISFPPMTIGQWDEGGSWWDSSSEEFRKGIKHLRCVRPLSRTIQEKLLQRFPSVNGIDFVSFIDDTDADGVIAD